MRTHRSQPRVLSRFALLYLAPGLAGSYRFGAVWDGAKIWKGACISTEGDRNRAVGESTPTATDLSRYTAMESSFRARRISRRDCLSELSMIVVSVARPPRSAQSWSP